MHKITTQRQYMLRIDITDWGGMDHYAQYTAFSVGSEQDGYRISFHGHHGSMPDSLGGGHSQQGMMFTTFDRDHDLYEMGNCADNSTGGWWHRSCFLSNLNGQYVPQSQLNSLHGIQWYQLHGSSWSSNQASRMSIRPTFDDSWNPYI